MDFIEADIREFIAACAPRFCPTCGEPIRPDKAGHRNGRPRTFCSDACRQEFWKEHPKKEKWGCYDRKICPVCGGLFYAQHETKRERKYCSRACANRGRAAEGRRADENSHIESNPGEGSEACGVQSAEEAEARG